MMSAPKTMSGRRRLTSSQKAIGVVAQMAALHALEHHVVAGLQGEMQMRHQPGLAGDRVEKVVVRLDRVDGGEAQPLELRHVAQEALHQGAELRLAGQVRAVAGDVDAGEHHLARAVLDEDAHLLHHRAHRARSGNCRGRKG